MADLLPGRSDAEIAENVRVLKQQGYSEQEATVRAHKGKVSVDDETSSDSEVASDDEASGADSADESDSDRSFVIVTKDFSGLGWAKKLIEEGEHVTVVTDYSAEDKEPKLKKAMQQVGQGWVEVVDLSDVDHIPRTDTTYWVFAENCFVDLAKDLSKEGQKVFPPSIELSEKMEHDRQYAIDVATKAGLKSMSTHEFQTREEGISFLEENHDTAYVFKPDDGQYNYMTFVPVRRKDADANRELYEYLAHMKKEPGSYILQERIPVEDSLEVNCEVWMYEGEPFLAAMGLELKRRNTYDIGEMSGCAGDFTQLIPLDSELVKQTVAKLYPFYKEQKYTGFADVNIIFDKSGTPYFLEVCNRFGYNAHPNLFLALALDGFGSLIADFTDGYVEGMAERFRTDVGCSLTLFIDHPRPGLPVHVDSKTVEQFYPFDGYTEEEGSADFLLTSYSSDIGVFVDHGATLEAAWKKVWQQVVHKEAVSCPDMYYRTDLAETNYYNAPVTRYKELKTRGFLA